MPYINVKGLNKSYKIGDIVIDANKNINFEVEMGELVVILGDSGAGKSTLLNLLGGMDKANSGDILIGSKNIAKLNDYQMTDYRRNDVGFVFQFYNLVPNLTAKENVELAVELVNGGIDPVDALKDVGLTNRINNFPAQLSGGEQQRVAIARAVAKKPKLLLCDEPTGALDYETGKQVLKFLKKNARKQKTTVIIVTHNSSIATIADKVIYMKDASIYKIVSNDNPKSIDDLDY
ncbi:MAG: ABC transporter ATP-binding protein [Lactobacillus sp.]|uniref:ABC transporter ATP-binding protein n=1 Tax=Bombilactobacillus bombi TaxID=1303590 RepID=UPI0035E82B3B|nr:ABC transporter ATP-binding protein [Lactobacillus sp.]MCO6542963.1 ABC transporter ATP-binding protein [Lactobacillus sp.]